jgi:hypothetical protein
MVVKLCLKYYKNLFLIEVSQNVLDMATLNDSGKEIFDIVENKIKQNL